MWLTGWTYRKSHIINPASTAGQNYQKRIVVHFGVGVDSDEDVYLDGECKTDFGDVRFVDNTGITLLDYWIEKKVDSDYAICWVEIADELSVYYKKIYVYYGNVAATSIANGDNTFSFFDDFESGLSKWTTVAGQLEGPHSGITSQHKMVKTSDDTVHIIVGTCFSTGSGNSYIKHFLSRDGGVNWENSTVTTFTPGRFDSPSIVKDADDNLYMAHGNMLGGGDGRIYFKKALADKSNPSNWVWTWQSQVTIDATMSNAGFPDIIVDSNNYIHVAYMRQSTYKSRWARSIDGGATWTREEITLPAPASEGYMTVSIDKDSQNNLYFGMGPIFMATRKFYVEKVSYLGGGVWSQGIPVAVSSGQCSYGQVNVLPDDRICAIYPDADGNKTISFRKTTDPRDVSVWDDAVLAADGTADIQNREFAFCIEDVDNLRLVYLSQDWHTDGDLVETKSSDGGDSWGAVTQLTDSAMVKRDPASLREVVGGKMLLHFRDYAEWEVKYGNLWFMNDDPSVPTLFCSSSPTLAADYAYSGDKCIRFAPLITSSIIKAPQSPYNNKAVHTHMYDLMSGLTEYTVFSFDVGEAEMSYMGIVTDVGQYEYILGGVTYNSGINRTLGWHEFVSRSVDGLKEFLVDGNLMPVTGISNYNPAVFIVNASTSQSVAYWDTVFVRKYVSPEPSHGVWGLEETEAPTIYTAEDIENDVSGPHQCDEIIYPLTQEAISVEDILVSLLGSPHTPTASAEDVIVALLAQRLLLSEDVIRSLTGSPHTPIMSSEDIIVSLLAKRLLLSEDVIVGLLAQRLLQGQDIIYTRPLLYRALMMAYPIFGGSHVMQVKGEEE